LARVSGLEDPLTSRDSTTPHTGCREEETSNSPDMVDKPLTRVLIQRRSAVGVSSVSAQRFARCRVLSSLVSSDLGAVRRLELCREKWWAAVGTQVGEVSCAQGRARQSARSMEITAVERP
jgi:hypothetical protein